MPFNCYIIRKSHKCAKRPWNDINILLLSPPRISLPYSCSRHHQHHFYHSTHLGITIPTCVTLITISQPYFYGTIKCREFWVTMEVLSPVLYLVETLQKYSFNLELKLKLQYILQVKVICRIKLYILIFSFIMIWRILSMKIMWICWEQRSRLCGGCGCGGSDGGSAYGIAHGEKHFTT